MIEQQTQTIMLADSRKDYAFKIIDAAVAPEDRERPNRTIILVIATFAGLALGLFYAVFSIYSLPMIKDVLGKDESEPLIELESIPFINRLFGKNI
jgi:capsular polysaccharide biosynthesis protein